MVPFENHTTIELKSAYKGTRSLYLINHSDMESMEDTAEGLLKIELTNQNVPLSKTDESLHWCKYFKLDSFIYKNHLIKVS